MVGLWNEDWVRDTFETGVDVCSEVLESVKLAMKERVGGGDVGAYINWANKVFISH